MQTVVTFLGQDPDLITRPEEVGGEAFAFCLFHPCPLISRQVKKAQQSKKRDKGGKFLKLEGGWSIPVDNETLQLYRPVLEELYRFYGSANEELYRLMTALGPGIGWRGRFPTRLCDDLPS